MKIEELQENAKTKFEGFVNNKKFTDRKQMNEFIGECISTGIPITDFRYSVTTHFDQQEASDNTCEKCTKPGTSSRDAIRQKQETVSWFTYLNKVGNCLPRPYDNIISFVVPFIHEDSVINQKTITDFKDHLQYIMYFLENYIFTPIRTWKYDDAQVEKWLNMLLEAFIHKCEWVDGRIEIIENFFNSKNEDKFIINHIDASELKDLHVIYTETSGFCRALIDIIKDLQNQLQHGEK